MHRTQRAGLVLQKQEAGLVLQKQEDRGGDHMAGLYSADVHSAYLNARPMVTVSSTIDYAPYRVASQTSALCCAECVRRMRDSYVSRNTI